MSGGDLEANLKYCDREFSTLLQNSSDLISQIDRNLRFLYVSPSVSLLCGIPTEAFVGKTAQELVVRFHVSAEFDESCRRVFATGKRVDEEFEYGERWDSVRINPAVDTSG